MYLIDITRGIERDKLAHFFGSYIALVIASLFLPILYTYIVVFALVILKDVVNDLILKKGQFSLLDMIFGSLPIIFDIISKL